MGAGEAGRCSVDEGLEDDGDVEEEGASGS